MKHLTITLIFMSLSLACMAQSVSNTFEYEDFKFEITSETTVKVIGVQTRQPDKPLPISYYHSEYIIPTFALDRNGKKYTVTSIGERAFIVHGGQDDFRVEVPASVKRIEKEAFYHTPMTDIKLVNGLEYIGEEAFAYTRLRTLTIPGSVKELGTGICSHAQQLQSLTVVEGVKALPEDMCTQVHTLKDVNLANSISVIGNGAFRNCDSVNVIRWPSQLQVIEAYAFEESGVSNGSFPNKLQEIGDFAFFRSKIKKADLPASLKKIGDIAFRSRELECYTVNNANPVFASYEGLLMNKKKTEIIDAPYGKKGHQLLPSTLREVGEFAFLGCSIEEVTLPPTLKVIRKGGFEECEQLKVVHFNEGLDSIGDDAFRRCKQLGQVTLPASLKSVSGNAFYLCQSLKDIKLSPGSKYLVKEDGDIYDANHTTLLMVARDKSGAYTVRDGVVNIGSHAFSLSDGITEVNIPASVKTIDEGAFGGCEHLRRISLPNGLEVIGDWAFYDCGELVLSALPASLKKLGRYAFDKNESLTSITIPESVTQLPEGLFRECKNLVSVRLPEGLTAVDQLAFQDCTSLPEVTLPSSVTSLGSSVFSGCTSLNQVNLPQKIHILPAHFFAKCQSLQHVILPESTDSIMDSAFTESGLTSLVVLGNVRHIGKYAFYKCEQLSSVTLSNSLDSIENGTFSHCKSLKGVTLPKSIKKIGDYAFSYCESLDEIIVPEGVERLGIRSFEFCLNLGVIDLPSTLKEIERDAFVRVDKPKTIIIRATTPPKGKLDIRLLKNTTVYLPAGTFKAYASGLLRSIYGLESRAQEIK